MKESGTSLTFICGLLLQLRIPAQVIVLSSQACRFGAQSCYFGTHLCNFVGPSNASFPFHPSSFTSVILRLISVLKLTGVCMDPSQVLVQVFLARKSLATMSLAIWVRAVELLSWSAVEIMNFSLMSQETAGVGETWELFATIRWAFVGSIMFVHVLDRSVNDDFKYI